MIPAQHEMQSADRTLIMTRIFDAPRELVFAAWTEPDHLARWWGCAGTKVTRFTGDFRVGGGFRVTMRLEDGSDHRVCGVCREFVRPERLSFTWASEDENGVLGHETVVTVSFADLDGRTELTLHQAEFESVDMRDQHETGWTMSFDRLVAFVADRSAA